VNVGQTMTVETMKEMKEEDCVQYLPDCIHSDILWRRSCQQVKQLTQQLR